MTRNGFLIWCRWNRTTTSD